MSEYVEPEYVSEFQAPPFTIVEQKTVGQNIVTTVILDGELATFEVNATVHALGKAAVKPLADRFYNIVQSLRED